MRHFNTLRNFLLASAIGAAGAANAQTAHPLAFTTTIGTTVTNNWYADYVGLRFAVTAPSAVAGTKSYSQATVAQGWTIINYSTLPLINVDVKMGPAGDTDACAPFSAGYFAGKIALIWRGSCEFGFKALQAQNAGAVAVVIVNNQPGGLPIGMGAGASGASVTIPTFMIGNTDGLALSAVYAGGTGATIKMTITPWGQNLRNDLGFVPQGVSTWHNFAIPRSQMTGTLPVPYKGMDGAFIANYGSSKATNVKLGTQVTFTPTSGTATTIHSNTVALAPLSGVNFNPSDSIYALFNPLYDITGVTGNGVLTTNYRIMSDSTDQFAADDTISVSSFINDDVYSKGRYDFVNRRPLAGTYTSSGLAAGDEFYIWGTTYFVNKANGDSAKNVQWTMSSNSDTAGTITTIATMNVYLFKWVDGGVAADSFIQNGELELIGTGLRDFASGVLPGDTSGGVFTAPIGDSTGVGRAPALTDNTWYYIAPEVPTGWFLGCDGTTNHYPRTYGLAKFNNILEYYTAVWPSGRYAGTNNQISNGNSSLQPCPFSGTFVMDSVVFESQKGLIPSVPLITSYIVAPVDPYVGVKNVNQAFAKFELFPNPATEYVTINLGLDAAAKNVTYTVIDNMARTISKEVHHNVQNEKFTISTSTLAAGNYYVIVSADGKQMFKKFAVIK